MDSKLMSREMRKNRFIQDSCVASAIVLMALSTIKMFSLSLLLAVFVLSALVVFKTIEVINNYVLKRIFTSHFRKNGLKFEENKVYDRQYIIDHGVTIIGEGTPSDMPDKFMVLIMDNRAYPLLLISFVVIVMSLFLPHHRLMAISAVSLFLYMLFT